MASHGPEQEDKSSNNRHFWDFIFAIKPFEKTAFNLNIDYGTEKDGAMFGGKWNDGTVHQGENGQWWGFAGIVNQDITDSFGLALRGEYFDDNDGARLGVNALNVWEITLTANIKIRENLLVRPELRYDEANQEIFNDREGELTTAIGVAYMF